MIMKKHIFLVGLLVILSVVITGCQTIQNIKPQTPTIPPDKIKEPGDYLEIITVDGNDRVFHVNVPPDYRYGDDTPLVISFHGRTANMYHQLEISQLQDKSDEEGFILVTPQGVGNPSEWLGAIPGEMGREDHLFVDELLDFLNEDFSIDPSRIFLTGFSNGASFANHLGCIYSDRIAAVAPVAGGHVGFYDCENEYPVSVIAFHGLNDPIIPYVGDQYNPQVSEWVIAWAERNGCDLEPLVDDSLDEVNKETWENCDGNTTVILYSISGAGHTWPGSNMQLVAGGSTQALNATDLIWEFFENHPIDR